MRLNSTSRRSLAETIDWKLVICYLLLIFIGWMNIYASVHSSEAESILDMGSRSGKQFIWIISAIGLAGIILFIFNPNIYESFSFLFYIFTLGMLIAVIFLGVEVKGSRSWFAFGDIRFQPAEISKIATSLMLATVMSQSGYRISNFRNFIITALVILVPMVIIVAQSETGSALVYVGFIFMLYREGLSGWLIALMGLVILTFILTLTTSSYVSILVLGSVIGLTNCLRSGKMKKWLYTTLPVIILFSAVPFICKSVMESRPDLTFLSDGGQLYLLLGVSAAYTVYSVYEAYRERNLFKGLSVLTFTVGILLVFSVDFVFNEVLQDHQRKRIEVLLGMKEDPMGVGYNVNQSMIAIGSGGFLGKGFMNGTQTTYGFVPEQTTDFIFCTIGEEWGFAGSSIVILLYVFMIWRIISDAEKSRENFTRIYGYCVASCIFMHLFINIGMTIGLMPVIGIPLPFISYGGSSLWAFTILLFIFIALNKKESKYF